MDGANRVPVVTVVVAAGGVNVDATEVEGVGDVVLELVQIR